MSDSENSTVREPIETLEEGEQLFGEQIAVSSFGKSPYTDQKFVALDVGSARTRFLVHRTLLEQSPVLSGKANLFLWGDKSVADVIPLPDLDEPTAHTLVHYLYTGIFQTLRSSDLVKEGMLEGYKLGTCVYCAATRYNIPGLANLAKDKITFCGDSLPILDILIVAREVAFPVLPDDEVWFPTYLETAIKDAFNKDPELFSKPDFSDQIEGDRRYRQVVMKAILNAVARGPVAMKEVQPEVPKTAEETVKVFSTRARHDSGTQELPKKLNSTTEPEVDGSIKPEEETTNGVEAANETPTTVETSKAVEPVFDADDPVVEETHAKPEPVTDETGWGKSTTYQSMGGKKSKQDVVAEDVPPVQETVTIQAPAPSIQEPITKQESPAVEETEPLVKMESKGATEAKSIVEKANAVSKESVGESTPTGEDAVVQNEPPTSKKNRKKKKKAAQAANTVNAPVAVT